MGVYIVCTLGFTTANVSCLYPSMRAMCHRSQFIHMYAFTRFTVQFYMHYIYCKINDKSYAGENFCSFYKFSTNHENLLYCAVAQFWVPIYVVICKKFISLVNSKTAKVFLQYDNIQWTKKLCHIHTFYHLQYLCLHREDIHISSDNAIQLT